MKILSEAVISKCGKRGDRIKELEAENKKLNMETYEQMELMKKGIERIKELEKENEELKTMVNRNAGDAIYHQAEKIKLQDINATLKAQLDEAGEIIGGLLGTAKGYELEHRKDKLYTVRQRIERGEQFLAKLDLLEKEVIMSTKNCDNCEHEDKREPFNYGDCEECKRFHIDADETFKDMWTQKVTNDYEKEFDEKFCPKGIGQCKVLNTEDPCDACKLVWNACAEMMRGKEDKRMGKCIRCNSDLNTIDVNIGLCSACKQKIEKPEYACGCEEKRTIELLVRLKAELDQANKVIQEQQERIKELENNQVKRSPTELFREILTELEKESDKIPSYTQLETKVKDLQQKLDKAVEIIKDFCDMSFDEHPDCKYQRAEEFLATVEGNNETN